MFDLKQYEVERGSLLADYAFDLDGSEFSSSESISNPTDDSLLVKNETTGIDKDVASETNRSSESFLVNRDDSLLAGENRSSESFHSDVSKKVCKDFSNDLIWHEELNDSLLFDNPHGCINTYSPGGTARGKRYYFRYSYYEGSRKRHIHIKGGSISSNLARSRAGQVNEWIAQKLEPREIVQLVSRFGKGVKP